MLSVRKVLLPAGFLALAGLSSPARAQGLPAVPAVPGVAAPAAAAPAEVGPGPVGRILVRLDAFRRRIALTPVGQLLQNAKKPLAGLTGGLLGGPLKPTDKEAAAPGPAGAAAAGKKDAAEAKKRREDIAYLGTLDCRYYPNASQALADALRTDPSECVRWEAAIALSKSCCCNNTTIKALMASVSGMEPDGNPAERSARVRCTAAVALERCLACYTPPYEEPETKDPKKGEKTDPMGEQGTPPMPPPTGSTTARTAPSPQLVQKVRETLAEFQSLMAVSAPQLQPQIDPPQKSVVHLLQASFSTPTGQPAMPVAPPQAHPVVAPAPVTVARTPPRTFVEPPRAAAAAPPAPRTESVIAPAAAIAPKFVPDGGDAAILKGVSVRCLNADDVSGQHQAIRELMKYDWKAQPLVASTLLFGAKASQFKEEVRVDCVRMLAVAGVSHPQVIDGLTGLATDPSEWIRQEAAKAVTTLTAAR